MKLMHKLLKFKFIFFIIIIVLIIFVTLIIKNINTKNSKIQIRQIKMQDIVKDRYIYEKNNEIIIGKNLKEIENGYYDVDINFDNKKIRVIFNKLYKEEYSNNLYVDENYLFEILLLINNKFCIGVGQEKLQELNVLISDMYLKCKNYFENKEMISGILNNEFNYSIIFDDTYLIFELKLVDVI